MNSLAVPLDKNLPSSPLHGKCCGRVPLGQDLQTVADYVEGYPVEVINVIVARTVRVLFGQTLSSTDIRLPRNFHKTALGQLFFDGYARYYPADA